MADRAPIGPNDAHIGGRMRAPASSTYSPMNASARPTTDGFVRPIRPRTNFIHGRNSEPIKQITPKPSLQAPIIEQITIIKPQPQAIPAAERQQKSTVLHRQFVKPIEKTKNAKSRRRYAPMQIVLVSMACLVFVVGLLVSLQTMRVNKNTTAQVAAIAHSSKNEDSHASNPAGPSTKKPTSEDISKYVVAADLPRYIKIPSLDVYGRVTQVGATKKGALDAPKNVYDASWYTGSAKPGQPGASLLDGHVSSWSTKGVFHDIKNLKQGDIIQIVRGDNKVLSYKVVTTKIYDVDKVDMNAALHPIKPGIHGLNLITCDGKVKSGSHEFDKRVIVFAEQV